MLAEVTGIDTRTLRKNGAQSSPYPWSEDEIVTRRDTLRFLLAGSGALFLATGVLTIVGNPHGFTKPSHFQSWYHE